jgi:hypothetical protein
VTVRLGHARKFPFLFPNKAIQASNLPCIARVNTRGTFPFYYPEFAMFPGPASIGVTGTNRLIDIIGNTWAILFCHDYDLKILKWTGSGWQEITANLPPFPLFDSRDRRFSGCFDQSARLIYAFERDETIYLTRWDAVTNEYVQNVTVAGVDPVVVFDASWAYDVPESDVLLFYLSTDRTRLMCRVQRQLFATELEVHDYGEPVVLDRIARLPLRYEVLASDEVGDPLVSGSRVALVSDFYPYPAREDVIAGALPLSFAYTEQLVVRADEDALLTASVPLAFSHDDTLLVRVEGEELVASAVPLSFSHDDTLLTRSEGEALLAESVPLSPFRHDLALLTHVSEPEFMVLDALPLTFAHKAS